jgi:dihydropteroate synthase
LVEAGADALDLGAESSRPGSAGVPADEELARLLPVLESVTELGVPVSVDTVKASVARRALQAGASIINDISALSHDPAMAEVCAEAGCPVVLMHMRGTPRDMQTRTDYDDVVAESVAHLKERIGFAREAGIRESNVVIDPGIGFAKTADQCLEILAQLSDYHELGRPVLLGASRKSFLARFAGEEAGARLEGTLAVSALAVLAGVSILRVHDVAENLRAVRTVEAIGRSRRAFPGDCAPGDGPHPRAKGGIG